MQGEQRVRVDEGELAPQDRLWQPFTVHGPQGDRQQRRRAFKHDNYVVIEDIEDGRVVFEVSSWPQIDKGGRLHFEGDPYELYEDQATAQAAIDEARRADGVTGSDRPIRIGDVFLVRDLARRSQSIGRAGTIRDISLAARIAAKAALFGAAASTVEEAYVEEMAIEREPDELRVRRGWGRSVAAKVIDDLPLHPVVDTQTVAERYDVAPQTAHEALLRLSEAEVLVERPLSRRKKGRPRRVFAATELIDLLSNQEDRIILRFDRQSQVSSWDVEKSHHHGT